MVCEVCAEPTKEEHSDRPEGEDYFVWVTQDLGLGIQKFRFCSIECLRLFTELPGGRSINPVKVHVKLMELVGGVLVETEEPTVVCEDWRFADKGLGFVNAEPVRFPKLEETSKIHGIKLRRDGEEIKSELDDPVVLDNHPINPIIEFEPGDIRIGVD